MTKYHVFPSDGYYGYCTPDEVIDFVKAYDPMVLDIFGVEDDGELVVVAFYAAFEPLHVVQPCPDLEQAFQVWEKEIGVE